jgi:hypothetical protein
MDKEIKNLKRYHDKQINQIYEIPSLNFILKSELTDKAIKILFEIEILKAKKSIKKAN